MADTTIQLHWALQELANGIAAAFEGMSGSRPEISVAAQAGAPSDDQSQFRWQQRFNSLPAPAYAAASDQDALAAGQHVMAAAGVDECSTDELKSTFTEILGQAFSMFARSITTRMQREVTTSSGQVKPELPSDGLWGSLHVTLGDSPIAILAGFPAAFLEALNIEPKSQAATAGASGNSVVTTSAPAVRSPIDESKTFDLLLDVELPVSVSFGHAQVPLKDVLKLTTGSIVELSRAIVEPVDVVVNNCVIAKGEVVVVEGNFGVRIQHVISRSERLRTIQ